MMMMKGKNHWNFAKNAKTKIEEENKNLYTEPYPVAIFGLNEPPTTKKIYTLLGAN